MGCGNNNRYNENKEELHMTLEKNILEKNIKEKHAEMKYPYINITVIKKDITDYNDINMLNKEWLTYQQNKTAENELQLIEKARELCKDGHVEVVIYISKEKKHVIRKKNNMLLAQ